MAAILRREARNERRLPERAKAVREAERSEAGKLGVHKNNATIPIHAQLMHIKIARRLRIARHIVAVEAIHRLPGRENILQPPYLMLPRKIEPLRCGDHTHRMNEMPFVKTHPPLRHPPDEIEPPALIGGETETQPVALHEAVQPPRA